MKFLENLDREKLNSWFESKMAGREPFFYSSVDLRNSGHKVAAVDTNLFPAGFNNLSEDAVKNAIEEAKKYFTKYHPNAKTIALVTENFSRNKFYWDNITALKNIVEQSGHEVLLAVDDATMPAEVESNSGNILKINKISFEGGKLKAGDVIPDLVLLNRDFTSGSPLQFSQITQAVIPPASMGWHARRKSQHFESYNILAEDFGKAFNIDPWLISTIHKQCNDVDFKSGKNMELLAEETDKILTQIRTKYAEYGVQTEAYVYIKSDSGTFGMGIMTVKSGSEVLEMNKKLRNKMDRIKEGVHNTEVIIQEGVPTIDELDGKPAEPFLYCINGKPIGAILRVNENRDQFENLNSAGMFFEPVKCEHLADPCQFSPFGIIARLASLAAVYEAENMKATEAA